MTSFITTVKGATFPDGDVAPVYAYVTDDRSCGVAMTIKRAIEMQRDEGVEYRVTDTTPADYGVWYEPDFPSIGKVTA